MNALVITADGIAGGRLEGDTIHLNSQPTKGPSRAQQLRKKD